VSGAGDYSRADVVAALRAVGVRAGDVVFSHTSIGMLGVPAGGLDRDAVAALFRTAFEEVLGADGIWLLPAYTYSYTSGEPFDPATSKPKNMGLLTDALWQAPGVARSLDPIFSVIGMGANAHDLLSSIAVDDCFGPASVYARLLELDATLCNIGIGVHGALIHHVEQKLGVPYRFPKLFRGTTLVDGRARETAVRYNVRGLDEPRHVPYFMRLDADARADGSAAVARVGRGEINAIPMRRLEQLIVAGLRRDPEYLVLGDQAGMPVG